MVRREEATVLVDLDLHGALGNVTADRDRIDIIYVVGVGGVDGYGSSQPVENQLRIGNGRRGLADHWAEKVQGPLDHIVAVAHVLQVGRGGIRVGVVGLGLLDAAKSNCADLVSSGRVEIRGNKSNRLLWIEPRRQQGLHHGAA